MALGAAELTCILRGAGAGAQAVGKAIHAAAGGGDAGDRTGAGAGGAVAAGVAGAEEKVTVGTAVPRVAGPELTAAWAGAEE